MRITTALGLLFLAGCGTDNFGPNEGGVNDAASESIMTVEGGDDARSDAMTPPKPRMFVTIEDIMTANSSALLAWDDPDALTTPRPPDVTIPLSDAADLVVAKNKRLIVAAFTKVHTFDGPLLSLSSSSQPKSFDKNAFQGLGGGDPSVVELAYDPTLDLLATVDTGQGELQSFKNASTMPIPTSSSARFGVSNEGYFHAAIGASGQLVGGKANASSNCFDGAQNGSGQVSTTKFVIGTGGLRIGGGHLMIATNDSGVGGAAVYVYDYPIAMTMQSWVYEIRTGLGNPGQTDNANDVALSPNWMAVSVKTAQASTGFICVFSNPSSVNASSTCANKIPVNNGVPFKMFERNSRLYVAVHNPPSNSSVQMFKTPLTDTTPTITFPIPTNKLATGFGIAEPN